jgi:hypothetical protein
MFEIVQFLLLQKEENRDLKESLRCIELEKDRYISKLVQHPVIKKVLTEFSNSSKNSVTRNYA